MTKTFKMVSVEQARKIILASVSRLSSEEVKITAGLERVLAENVYADCDIPQLDNSAMDGYALRAADLRGAAKDNPVTLDVIADLPAGYLAAKKVKRRQAIRIMTGAPLPEGADSVVMVEYTESRPPAQVKIFRAVRRGENVRRRAEDIKKGQLVLAKNTLLDVAHIGILASLGKVKVKVTRRPRVAILTTGDELVDVGRRLRPGKLYSSNTYTLYNQILKSGGRVKNLGIARDRSGELEWKIKSGLDCDLILSSGGVSVGDYDLVKPILAKLSTRIKFWKVAMRPGKPLVFGLIRDKPIFGLPGNPVSSMLSFEFFVRPTILKMLGQEQDTRKEVDALLEEDIEKKKGLRYFVRARTRWENGVYLTRTTGAQGSGILTSMALANSLIILPEQQERVKKGARVKVRFLNP